MKYAKKYWQVNQIWLHLISIISTDKVSQQLQSLMGAIQELSLLPEQSQKDTEKVNRSIFL